jgi:hypothetical protein
VKVRISLSGNPSPTTPSSLLIILIVLIVLIIKSSFGAKKHVVKVRIKNKKLH